MLSYWSTGAQLQDVSVPELGVYQADEILNASLVEIMDAPTVLGAQEQS